MRRKKLTKQQYIADLKNRINMAETLSESTALQIALRVITERGYDGKTTRPKRA